MTGKEIRDLFLTLDGRTSLGALCSFYDTAEEFAIGALSRREGEDDLPFAIPTGRKFNGDDPEWVLWECATREERARYRGDHKERLRLVSLGLRVAIEGSMLEWGEAPEEWRQELAQMPPDR